MKTANTPGKKQVNVGNKANMSVFMFKSKRKGKKK